MRGKFPIVRQLREKTAVKDVIEACGVPHPEIDLIVVSLAGCGKFGLQSIFAGRRRVPVESMPTASPLRRTSLPSAPRLQTPHFDRFVTDGHLGKLARNLRLLGLDTVYARDADDRLLLEVMASENRALLTRDRRLLRHSVVRHGFCPRSADPEQQTEEVLRRFGLLGSPGALAPFNRCLECNGLLESVPKAAVLERLAGEPLTLRYYDDYRMCSKCGRIYWAGTHFDKLVSRVSRFVGH